jgi:hypothetical protein
MAMTVTTASTEVRQFFAKGDSFTLNESPFSFLRTTTDSPATLSRYGAGFAAGLRLNPKSSRVLLAVAGVGGIGYRF